VVNPARIAEDAAVREAAERYRRAGFEVSEGERIDLCGGYEPDLVARKGQQVTVVEIKPRSALAADSRIAQVAREIDSMPNWSIELVIVAEPELLEAPTVLASLDEVEIEQRLAEVEELMKSDRWESAFLLAWSALEARLRNSVAADGDSEERVTNTRFLLNQASFLGVLDEDEMSIVRSLYEARNAIAHGFSHSGIGNDEMRELIALVRRESIHSNTEE
jgi:Holliday junction resolvase-like predicted endonuclease